MMFFTTSKYCRKSTAVITAIHDNPELFSLVYESDGTNVLQVAGFTRTHLERLRDAIDGALATAPKAVLENGERCACGATVAQTSGG